MFNYKCPNGNPPELCWHIPQLVLNTASYLQKKQELRKESTEIQARSNIEQSSNTAEGLQDKQKQRRRG